MLAGASRGFPDSGVTEKAESHIPRRGRGGASPSGVFPLGIGGIMFGRLRHLATFGLSALSLGLALLAVTPESAQSRSRTGFATGVRERTRLRPWVGSPVVKVPHFDVHADPSCDLFELAGVSQVYYQ